MLSIVEEWEMRFIQWTVHNGLRRRSYYAVSYTPNSPYSSMGSGCEVMKFMTRAARDRFVAESPIKTASDYFVGGRQAIGGNWLIRDKGQHEGVLAWRIATASGY